MGLTSAPFDGDTILSMEDAKHQLNLMPDDTYNEPKIVSARDDAIAEIERYSQHSLQEREFVFTTDRFTSRIALPLGPVTSVDEVLYYDTDGADMEVDASGYTFGGNTLAPVIGATWPASGDVPSGVRITFTAGFATADDIPRDLIRAVKLAMTAYFHDRITPDLTGAHSQADGVRPVLG